MKTQGLQKLLHILAITAVVCFCLQTFSDNKADVDLWGNVGFVRALPWTEGYHYTNTFSYSEPDHPWTNHEWGAEYIFWIVYCSLGNTGLLALKILLGLALLWILYASIRRECPDRALQLLLVVLVVSTMGYGYSTRPHHFTYLALATVLFAVKYSPRNRVVMLLGMPLLGLAWANLHGAFFVGVILLLAWGLLDSLTSRRLSLAIPACLLFILASFINPYGVRLWEFIGQSAAKTRPYLSEWAPFNPLTHGVEHVDFIVLSCFAVVVVLFSPKKREDLTGLVVLGLGLLAAVSMRRNIPLFAILCAMILPKHLYATTSKPMAGLARRISPGILVILLALFIPASAWSTITFNKHTPLQIEIPEGRFPVQARRFIQANEIKGNAIVFFDWAEYCIWHLYPDTRVFMDGRFRSAYGLASINAYLDFIYGGEDWEQALTGYETDMALLHVGNPATARMRGREGWTLVYEDRIACIYLRDSVHAGIIERLQQGKGVLPDAGTHDIFP